MRQSAVGSCSSIATSEKEICACASRSERALGLAEVLSGQADLDDALEVLQVDETSGTGMPTRIALVARRAFFQSSQRE